jgi:heme exporter protein B
MFNLVLTQTIKLSFRKGGGALGTLAFYLIVFTLFTFALGVEAMREYALAVMCVGLVLASVTAQPLIFERDEEEGMLEQFVLKSPALELVVLAKLIGGWIVQLLPILLLMPLFAAMAGLDGEQTKEISMRLALLSPSISAIAVLTAAFTLGSKRGGLLPALISLPLLMPIVIFASSIGGNGALLLLAAAALVSVPFSCYVSATLLRMT